VAVKRRAHRGGKVEHSACHLKLRLFKPGCCHTPAEWPVEHVEKTHGHAEIRFHRATGDGEENGTVKDGVCQEPRLDDVGLGDAELGIGRLKLPIVQERHLDGRISRERAG
jgi:hypothetical protein